MPTEVNPSWTQRLDARPQAALRAAAEALLAGDPAPAAACLRGWRFVREPALAHPMLRALVEAPPQPASAQLAALFAPAERVAPPPADWALLDPSEQRDALVRACVGLEVPATLRERLAWGIDELAFLGEQVDHRQRRAWAAARYPADPKRDALTRTLWEAWFTNRSFFERERWERLFLPQAARAFGAVLEARQFPSNVRHQVQEDLQESFFFSLLGGMEGPPGWQELAVRVVETAGAGPIDAVTPCLDPGGWRRVAACAVRRGHGPRSAALAFGELPNALARARALRERGEHDPGALEDFLDLHVALRLVDTWSQPGHAELERSWRVILQNRGRAGGRLRAVLAGADAGPLWERLSGLDGLHARTLAAVGRHCRDWAWQQLSRGFTFDYGRSVSPPCLEGEEAIEPMGPGETAALRAWVMLCLVRGRLGHLRRWVQEGSTGDRDTQWGRLQQEIPEPLRDAASGSRSRYHRVRAELAECLPELLRELRPAVEAIAALKGQPKASLPAPFTAAIRQVWVEGLAEPKVRYEDYVANVHKALDLLRGLEDDDAD